MEIGEALYYYRKKLGLTMEEMSVGIVTPSFYSKVEKGIHRISAEDLFHILNTHGIDITKFVRSVNISSDSLGFDRAQHQILQYYTRYQSQNLIQLKNQFQGDSSLNQLEKDLLTAIVDVYLADLNDDISMVAENTKHFLQDKLFNAENWDSYKLSLYTNIMDLYDLEVNRQMIFSILRKNLDAYTSKQRMMILAILNNFIYTCIRENEDKLARYCLTIINKEVTLYENLPEKIHALFYQELLAYRATPHSLHVDKIERIIDSLSLYGLEETSHQFRKFYEENKNCE